MHRFFSKILAGTFLVAIIGCTQQKPDPSPTIGASVTPSQTSTHTQLPPTSIFPKISRKPTRTNTPRPTRTPIPTLPMALPDTRGTSLPSSHQVIDANNYTRLSNIAQWGKGYILDVVFTPDGSHFVVGSVSGFAVYQFQDITRQPRWVSFDIPFGYDKLYFSRDGSLLLLDYGDEQQVRRFSDGTTVTDYKDVEWLKPQTESDWRSITAASPDGTLEFFGAQTYEYDEEMFSEEKSIRRMSNTETDEVIYELTDFVPYVHYSDHTAPEGCDLRVFSPCGNALMSLVSSPYDVAFSPSGDTFTVIYRPASLYNSRWFSTLRIYRTSDGKLLGTVGSFNDPVEAFAYTPDNNKLIIASVDGAIRLWDIPKGQAAFGAWHFSSAIRKISYSNHGEYLLIQRLGTLEVRRTSDGSLRSRYESITFALSPTENIVAIGNQDGEIKIHRLDTGQTIHTIEAHKKRIYALAFSPDGKRLVSSGEDCAVRTWDVTTGEFIHYYEEIMVNAYGEGPYFDSRIFIYNLRFIPNTNNLIGFGSWASVVNWNTNSGAKKYIVESAPLEYYQGMMTIKPHFPEYFRVDLENGRFYINELGYDISTGEVAEKYQKPANSPIGCSLSGPTSADGKLLFTVGFNHLDGKICILQKATFQVLAIINAIPEKSLDFEGIVWLFMSPNGEQLVAYTYSGTILVFEIAQ
ncbi:MAG: hypothetical protein OEZ02_05670 [Anaerolineae bacterium]|nr:hypothetical protein [Anaerolineae bacterium]